MEVSVIVPTYRRPYSLRKTLMALENQTLKPKEIIVVVREDDKETIDFLKNESIKILRVALIKEGGQVIAMNEGIKNATGDVIAFTDDDAEPEERWIEKIIEHMEKDEVGAVGGRDFIAKRKFEKKAGVVGKITWFGRIIGNHHLDPINPASREVEVIKGVNMAYKKKYIDRFSFDTFLDNRTSPMNEVDICMYVKKKGKKIIYDPNIKVFHYVEERKSSTREEVLLSTYEYSRNYTYVMLKHLPLHKKLFFLLYSFLIGQRASYGLLTFMIDAPIKGKKTFALFTTSQKGKWHGLKGYLWRILHLINP